MKRDMDLVRKILLEMEKAPHGFYEGHMVFEGYTSDQTGFHMMLMIQAGLIEGNDVTTLDSIGPEAIPTCITWQGYDFLDACRNEGIWAQAKEKMKIVGGEVPIEVLKTLLIQLLTAAVLG